MGTDRPFAGAAVVSSQNYRFNFNSGLGLSLPEQGYADPMGIQPMPATSSLPPGGGGWPVPHLVGFSGLHNLTSRSYRSTFDEALRDSPIDAKAMRRDPVIMHALRERQMQSVQLAYHVDPRDETDQAQQDAVSIISDCLDDIDDWQALLMFAQEALWFGRAAAQIRWEWRFIKGERRLMVAEYDGEREPVTPVNGDKLAFKWSGQAGMLVNLYAYNGPVEPWDRGMVHFLTPQERECFVIHHWEREDSDFNDGELAGSVMGTGIRGRLYWFWRLKQEILALLMKFLTQSALGIWVVFYDYGNPDAKAAAEVAINNLDPGKAVLLPRLQGAGGVGNVQGIQRVEPGGAGAAMLEQLVTGWFDGVIRRYILGQALTNDAGSSEVGGDAAGVMADHVGRIVKYDAVYLQSTIQRDLVRVMAKYNCPGVACPKFRFEIDKPNVMEYLQAAQICFEMGMSLDEDDLRSVCGFPKPEEGHGVLNKLMGMDPAGVGQVPAGVPATGPAGPVPVGPDGQPMPPDGQLAQIQQGQGGPGQVPVQMRRRGQAVSRDGVRRAFGHLQKMSARRKRWSFGFNPAAA